MFTPVQTLNSYYNDLDSICAEQFVTKQQQLTCLIFYTKITTAEDDELSYHMASEIT